MRCGSLHGWNQHKAANTRVCKWCEPYDPRLANPKKQVVVREPKKKVAPKPRTPTPYKGPVAECGTYPGYNRHKRLKEASCRPCKDASNAYAKSRYKPSTRVLVECGTYQGRRKHQRLKEAVCAPCMEAPGPERKAA